MYTFYALFGFSFHSVLSKMTNDMTDFIVLGKLSKKKPEDLVNLALFPLGPPLPTK